MHPHTIRSWRKPVIYSTPTDLQFFKREKGLHTESLSKFLRYSYITYRRSESKRNTKESARTLVPHKGQGRKKAAAAESGSCFPSNTSAVEAPIRTGSRAFSANETEPCLAKETLPREKSLTNDCSSTLV
ncbi:hypothetical protein CDAR_590211 [Caerostris darwini]|uniref:Uncharacterized protein n=1 Tax=Caerostris darwini TaxID=1538125 RepID=A0AAV4NRD2_9ARAC|nr:hypothetical protein CDAR_590211 [Caerostris darwini]